MLPLTELDSDSDEVIGVIPVAARVTWAVPEFVIIFIASVGNGNCCPVKRRKLGPIPRGTLQDIRPPDEDSEDEDSDPSDSDIPNQCHIHTLLY